MGQFLSDQKKESHFCHQLYTTGCVCVLVEKQITAVVAEKVRKLHKS